LLKEIFNIDYDYSFEIGKAYKLLEGKDINIITCGLTTSQALLAAKKLKEEGISPSVIHLPTLKPISKKSLLEALGPSKLILTVEEHSIIGGLGDAVLDTLSDMDYKIFKHGIKDTFPISGKAWELVSYFKLDAKGIEEKVKDILKKN
ncbi:MAG TPA: transketolase family protein, partial [Desulfurobacteriaceae bacterium]|nr:transketolase family protein [Desulfurobacteriaceae bacterium]